MLVVTLVTIILHNLALAVIVVYCICIGFAWDNAKRIQARTMRRTGIKHYEIYGPLFLAR
jgi:hypothetical protein